MVKSAKAFIFMHTNFRTHMIVCSSAYTQQIGLVLRLSLLIMFLTNYDNETQSFHDAA